LQLNQLLKKSLLLSAICVIHSLLDNKNLLIPRVELKSSIRDTVRRLLSSNFKPLSFYLTIVMLLCSSGCNDKELPNSGSGSLKAFDLAPNFELTSIDSKIYHLSDFKGKVVLLNFWATWCGPCVLEMPSLERLHQSLKAKGLEVITINMDAPGSDSAVKKFAESYGLNFKVLRDPQYGAADKYGVSGFPETFLIDREGKFIAFNDPASGRQSVRIISDRPWDSGKYLKQIESLL
jgi:peroxiredoxin